MNFATDISEGTAPRLVQNCFNRLIAGAAGGCCTTWTAKLGLGFPSPAAELATPAERTPVRTENSNPDVVVMEYAQDLERFDAPGPLNRARDRRILVQ